MTKLESIVVSNTEPNSKNVLWYDNKRLLIFSNGHWSPVVDLDDIDVDNVSNLKEALKSLNIKVDNKVDKVELDKALTAKQDKLVNSDDVTIGTDSKLTVTDLAKREVFDDWWIKVVGADGTVDHTHTESGVNKPYYLNKLWMTYDDARDINIACSKMRNIRNAEFMFANYKFRTLPKVNIYVGGGNVSADRMFQLCRTLEYIDLSLVNGFNLIYMMFRSCSNLHTIKGITMAQNIQKSGASEAFAGCVKLRNVEIRNAKADIPFPDSPLLSLDSIQYLVANAANTTPITVTLHPDAYARLTDEIITAAAAKQINFATETA